MEEQRQRMEDEARRTQAESATETPAGTETTTTGKHIVGRTTAGKLFPPPFNECLNLAKLYLSSS
jgi:hypothetical protein